MKKKVLCLSTFFVLLDQISKIIIDKYLVLGKSYTILDKFLYITKIYNDGISFSLLSGYRILIVLITIIIFFMLYKYMQSFKNDMKSILAFSLIYGGLLGNLIDRIVFGHVIDFIDFYALNYSFPVFNIADTFIFIGICLIILAIHSGDDNEVNSK